ncbi:MAG: zinc ribbon domain-containing protein, partial [Deltaproteobacteria bacterium]|nr:zinc ribbon domain-containing protein [Deltaproteobacteria bacterium]
TRFRGCPPAVTKPGAHMPIYEFKCRACGREFEELVLSGNASPVCPACGGGECDKLLSRFRAGVSSGGDFGDFGDFSAPAGGGGPCGGCAASSCAGCGVKS